MSQALDDWRSRFTPGASARRFAGLAVSGRLQFNRRERGAVFDATRAAGALPGRYEVFRSLEIKALQRETPAPIEAIVLAQFTVAGMAPWANKLFSWMPMPFFVGLPGFRTKRWMLDPQTRGFAGYYGWDRMEAAQMYGNSFAARFMKSRAVEGTARFTVYPIADAPPPPLFPGLQTDK